MREKNMKSNIRVFQMSAALALSMLLFITAGTSRATLVEGFESGFSGSEATKGDTSINSPTFFGIAPTQGTHQLVMTTISMSGPDGVAGYSHISQDAVPVAGATGLAAFFGVSTSSIRDGLATGQEGSGFTINLGVLTAGSKITFDYNFLTQEPSAGGNKDFSFFTLNNTFGGVITDVAAATFGTPANSPADPFGSQTQYHTFTINITTTQNYTLGLGVVDAGSTSTDNNPSALLVDNIQTIVPEPSTVAFAIAGAALLVVLRSRIKRTS
jgi:hypothetical protein